MRSVILTTLLCGLVACAPRGKDKPVASSGKATGPAVETGSQSVETDNGAVELRVLKGAPTVVGCADGQREAFADLGSFAAIAGCLAAWDGTVSLRAPKSGGVCGDDAGKCVAPADACAEGWHICAGSGAVSELTTRIDAEQCEQAAAGGSFVAAISHCAAQEDCQYGDDEVARRSFPCYDEGWCSEAVCCGPGCGTGSCPDGVWPGRTHIAQGTDQGCNAITAGRAGGVICCKD